MKEIIISTVFTIMMFLSGKTQSIGLGTNTPDSSALLEVHSNTKGFLPPRMNSIERDAISNPAIGLQIFNTTTNCVEIFVYNRWQSMFCGVCNAPVVASITGISTVDVGSNSQLSNTTPGGSWSSSDTNLATVNQLGLVTGVEAGSPIINYIVGVPGCSTIVSKTITVVQTFAIGQSYGGGIIVYVDASGQHGLIAAATDQTTSLWQSGGGYTTTGATDTSIGSGYANTTAIINSLGNTGTYAARVCRTYYGGGYNDWSLPSLNELHQLMLNYSILGPGIALGFGYMSSSEYVFNNHEAWAEHAPVTGSCAGNDCQTIIDKKNNVPLHVRAIRYF